MGILLPIKYIFIISIFKNRQSFNFQKITETLKIIFL